MADLIAKLRGEADIYASYDVITRKLLTEAAAALTTAQAEAEALKLDLAAQEALWDSAYRAGMKAGWNFCDSRNHEGYLRAQEGTEHIAELKRIRAARAALSGSKP